MPCKLLGPGTASRLLATAGEKRDGGRKEGGKPAAISHSSIERPGGFSLGSNPTQPSARLKNLKIKLVFGREERARPGGQATPGCRRERCCVMVPTWTPALCPFSLWKSRRAPEPRGAGFRVQKHPQSNGNETLGWVGRFPRFFSPSISKALQFLLGHQGSDLRRAKGTSAGSSMDAPGYWGQALFAFGAKESGEPSSPHTPPAKGCQTQAQETPAPNRLQPMACSIKSSSKGAKDTLNFFFSISFLLTHSARCHGV